MNNNILRAPFAAAALLATGTIVAAERPNVVVLLVDDMGYSDIGCYGGEIQTPNINTLADNGVRMTQYYTASRSCPTRASLMTGIFQHQAGIGFMSEDPLKLDGLTDFADWGIEGYRGFLNDRCVTMAEVLKGSDYNTYMVGKWHLGMHGMQKWPLQRGFDHFYGILSGACSYMRPSGMCHLTLDNKSLPAPKDPDYYTTDAFTDHAMKFISEGKKDSPFFLYLSYNAPHWPLQAKEADIAKYEELYLKEGWDNIRKDRYERMVELGIIPSDNGFAEWENRHWDQLNDEEKSRISYRMAVYAAQVDRVDQNIGRLVSFLKERGDYDNTIFFFMSDNGACAEPHREMGGGRQRDINNPAISEHPSYGMAWAQTSNTPFRKYKQRAYEGGISSPLIIAWGDRIVENRGEWCRVPAYVPDIMATVVDACGAEYPKVNKDGESIYPLVGESILPAIEGKSKELHKYMYWEHQGNKAIRKGDMKAVWDQDGDTWELYDLSVDRSETNNIAAENPKLVKKLAAKWFAWSEKHGVIADFPEELRMELKAKAMNDLIKRIGDGQKKLK